ncbi:hypothetical protein A6A04_00205 [Paramagnetospirillum marisnigri]|uniref:LytTR family transcriptional regulator n=1 Tax=Paramagnetospirillum marisnigri TaxID=1285242 RepID=A0A178MS03_9PROT|nr:DUF4159 domain-containing protein [Paramagnetospirillum marisnigri]OAN52168.1 hypothetical protein A6A04_00205 [Paramagnetospirillum marisnigri]
MSFLPGLAFGAPWALALLALLPLLWRLLRVTPPEPQRVRFPAISLLFGLGRHDQTPLATPPWLLLLRLALAAVLVLAAARPVIDPTPPPRGSAPVGALLLVVDDGWAAARDWSARRAFLDEHLERAGREARPVILLGTAPPPDGGPVTPGRVMTGAEAARQLAGLEPKPWAPDRRAAVEALRQLPEELRIGRVVWLHDGMDGPGAADLARGLQSLGGGLDMAAGAAGRQLMPPEEGAAADRLVPVIRRLSTPQPERLAVRGLDAAGTVLARGEVMVEGGHMEAPLPLLLPLELRNRLERLEIEGERSAAATVLLDERWRRRAVGLVAAENTSGAPLLDRLHYLDRALSPHAELRRGGLPDLLAEDGPGVLFLADLPLTAGPLAERLAARIEQGAVVIRFAGPDFARAAAAGGPGGDPLLPVRLRLGGRALGGAMSWTVPMSLAPFPETGPFHGLAIPDEVVVRSQVLAEPALDLAERSWASLADGTPLVTAQRRGRGWLVLVHSSANADWSNLPLSGLFVDMLRRLVALPVTEGRARESGPLPPRDLLDGFGRPGPASGIAAALPGGTEMPPAGPRHPPGWYGLGDGRAALNLSPRLDPPMPLPLPPGARALSLDPASAAMDLGPALLLLALLLLLADGLAVLALQGWWRRIMPLALLCLAVPLEAQAADAFALEAGQSTRLACIRTFDAAVDRDCLAGLSGLSQVLTLRSTANMAAPLMVDLERDPVVFFPLLYWRITPGQKALSARAAETLNTYMARGGLVVLDTADEGHPGAGPDTAELSRLRELARGLALPGLEPLGPDHVLNRAFYLLKSAPGRWDGTTVWVGRADGASDAHDGVSPVVLGGNDWVGAWAVDERGRPLHALTPGGERQREMAYRFGINLVMYALTGNYKADQVHLPAILERLGR